MRHQMREGGMPVDDFPEDDEVRETYNFAPGYRGIVYRADTPPSGARMQTRANDHDGDAEPVPGDTDAEGAEDDSDKAGQMASEGPEKTRYRLQAMQWGLIPFWTKRDPGFGSMIKTINCRDDSLAKNGGMWNTMKKNKRCIVVAQGFYEWQKKDNGRVKIPHFVQRKDGQLMCFAGLWDCVQYDGSEERLWTYTIITTDVNKQLSFLHDRMPVILNNGSEELRTWLDPSRTEWTKELQGLLRPFEDELDFYPVNKDVGKVGNNSPDFIVPIDSTENKSNIANFFGNAKAKADTKSQKNSPAKPSPKVKVEIVEDKELETVNVPRSEDNAPMPLPEHTAGKKHGLDDEAETKVKEGAKKQVKLEETSSPHKNSPGQQANQTSGRKTRSATSNGSVKKEVPKSGDGSQKITNFFGR